MDVPDDLRYSEDHEWARQEEGILRVGITDYARDALGDVVFVSLPEIGTTLEVGAVAGEVESTKAVSEIYVPVSGTITAVNSALADDPEPVNVSPYGDGWLFCIEPSDAGAYDKLLGADAYRTHIGD